MHPSPIASTLAMSIPVQDPAVAAGSAASGGAPGDLVGGGTAERIAFPQVLQSQISNAKKISQGNEIIKEAIASSTLVAVVEEAVPSPAGAAGAATASPAIAIAGFEFPEQVASTGAEYALPLQDSPAGGKTLPNLRQLDVAGKRGELAGDKAAEPMDLPWLMVPAVPAVLSSSESLESDEQADGVIETDADIVSGSDLLALSAPPDALPGAPATQGITFEATSSPVLEGLARPGSSSPGPAPSLATQSGPATPPRFPGISGEAPGFSQSVKTEMSPGLSSTSQGGSVPGAYVDTTGSGLEASPYVSNRPYGDTGVALGRAEGQVQFAGDGEGASAIKASASEGAALAMASRSAAVSPTPERGGASAGLQAVALQEPADATAVSPPATGGFANSAAAKPVGAEVSGLAVPGTQAQTVSVNTGRFVNLQGSIDGSDRVPIAASSATASPFPGPQVATEAAGGGASDTPDAPGNRRAGAEPAGTSAPAPAVRGESGAVAPDTASMGAPDTQPVLSVPEIETAAAAPLRRAVQRAPVEAAAPMSIPGVAVSPVPVAGLPEGVANEEAVAGLRGAAAFASERASAEVAAAVQAVTQESRPGAGGDSGGFASSLSSVLSRGAEASAMQPAVPQAPGSLPVLLGAATGRLGEELGQRILWLSGHNLRSAEIRLDPPELGPLQVQVHSHRDGASIQFTTHSAAVRDAVESNLPRLRELLESSGLNLLDVNVAQQQQGGAQGERGAFEAATQVSRERLAAIGQTGDVASPVRRTVGLVDDYA